MLDTKNFLVRALLVDGLVTEDDLKRASDHAAQHGVDLGEAIVATGVLNARRLAIEQARICEYPFVDIAHYEVDLRHTSLLPRQVAERFMAFPLFVIDGAVTVGMIDPLNLQAIDQLRQIFKMDIEPVICDSEQLKGMIARCYGLAGARTGGEDAVTATTGEEDLATGQEPIVVAVNQIIVGAIESGASDIHINPEEHELILRYRVDGVLQAQQAPPRSAHAGMVQRLKVLARLDLTQTRRPQDGKFRFTHRDQAVDIRLSVMPTVHGENVVMRLLRSATTIGTLQQLEMPTDLTRWYEEAIHRPYGMILVTGPTGSGKTTTLYCALQHINSPNRNIMTIEDPVEIRLPMVRQIQVNAEIGLSFAAALRSILRQDPDVVLVGEIRDAETAKIAVQAALTGHLVLSTLHTNDAVGSLSRLKAFDVPPFAINNALICVIAQRLLRRVCETCATEERPRAEDFAGLGLDPAAPGRWRRGVGCPACRATGYRGRVGAFEMMRVTARLQRLIDAGAVETDIRAALVAEGMHSMMHDGIDKARRGLTTLPELTKLIGVTEAEREPLRMTA